MPNWKKLIYSGSAAVLFNVSASSFTGSFTGSLLGTASNALSASWAPGGAAFPYTGSAIITGSLIVTGSVTSSRDLLVNGATVGIGKGNNVYNTVVGGDALFSANGADSDTAVGYQSLYSTTNGFNNTGVGTFSLFGNVIGVYNTGIGYGAGNNVTGDYNVAIGSETFNQNTGGSNRVAVGHRSQFQSSGNNNTSLGHNTLYSLTTGTGNVAIGYQAGYNETTSNKLYIANSSTSTPLIGGDFANARLGVNIAPASTTATLHTKGSGTTSTTTAFLIQNANNSSSLSTLDNGYVGIGTAAPVSLLNIYGGTGNNPAILTLQSITGGSGNTGIYFRPYQNEAFASTATAQATILAEDTNYSAHIKFSTKVPGASGNALTERMRITGAGSIGIGTTTPSASLHISGSTIISSSLVVGSGSLGSGENTLILGIPPSAGSGEGGQVLLSAPGGTYTSASMLDNYQNRFRILRGTNASSDAEISSFNMHNGQVVLNKYTGSGAFTGTAVAVLSVDTSGNVLTTSPVISFNSQGGSYTLASTDADKLIEMNSAAPNTLTVPTNVSVPIAVGTQFMVVQQNTGQTTIAAAGGVTLRSAGGLLNLANQYSSATLVKRAVDEWYIFGDLA